ncbi:hypothetical protein HII31_05091 [Pseudocercospora fuligena]|uniref:Uncharacterized protein n=1 Tax=Pseudocercospora fuligena TaxID=685502 RepID=A0A8H6RJC4_9PEZI|nr:hypothetical protein HII31_05091 [Pseudocercospora fuligena]
MAWNTGQSSYREAHANTTVDEPAMVPAHEINHAQSALSAAQKVFDVAELLERILLESAATSPSLPCTPLFVWQRVNWTFNNTIQRSKQLRQFMLLERVDDWIMDCIRNDEYEKDWMAEFSKYNSVRKANHMLLDTLFPLRRLKTKQPLEPYTFHKSEGPINGSHVTIATLLQILVESNTLSNIEAFFRPSIAAGLSQTITYLEPLFARQARVQTNQSWRSMKLCPVEEDIQGMLLLDSIVEIDHQDSEVSGCSSYACKVLLEGETTAGELMDTWILPIFARDYAMHRAEAERFKKELCSAEVVHLRRGEGSSSRVVEHLVEMGRRSGGGLTTMRDHDRPQAVRDWQRKKLEADLFRIKNPGLFQNWPVWKQDMWAFMR